MSFHKRLKDQISKSRLHEFDDNNHPSNNDEEESVSSSILRDSISVNNKQQLKKH